MLKDLIRRQLLNESTVFSLLAVVAQCSYLLCLPPSSVAGTLQIRLLLHGSVCISAEGRRPSFSSGGILSRHLPPRLVYI